MSTSLSLRGDTPVVALTGELDAYTSPQVRAQITAAGAQHTSQRVVLDLSAVTFIASAGLDDMVWATKLLRSRDADLVVTGVPAHAARLFEIAGISPLLTSDQLVPSTPSPTAFLLETVQLSLTHRATDVAPDGLGRLPRSDI
jgi:anti-sigma B factor antagonist